MLSTEASLITEKRPVLTFNIPPEPELKTSTTCSSSISSSTGLSSTNDVVGSPSSSNAVFLSELTKLFVFKLHTIIQSRRIFSMDEYPDSFTGEEAIVRTQKKEDSSPYSYIVSKKKK